MIEYVSWEDPVIGLQVEPFNWRLRKARQARGWSRAALARAAGVDKGMVGQAEKLRPVSANVREKLAFTLGIPEDELFPGVVDSLPVSGPGTLEIPFTAEQVDRWLEAGTTEALGALGDGIEHADLRADLLAVLGTLTPREEYVLTRRFGLDDLEVGTLEDIGGALGIGQERVRHLEAEALRKLRQPSRSRQIRYHVNRSLDGPLSSFVPGVSAWRGSGLTAPCVTPTSSPPVVARINERTKDR